jgi:hypothetical protein
MRRLSFWLTGSAFLLATAVWVPAQQPQPTPDILDGLAGPQLVAWTEMQKPQPVPEPKPDPTPLPDPQPEQQPDRQPNTQPPPAPPAGEAQPPSHSEEAEKTLIGTVVKDNDRFVLRTSDQAVYQLDDQARVKPFEGKQVRVVGRLDDQMTIHIDRIEIV